MKVLLVEPGNSVIQALADAYMNFKDEPITVCANDVRVIFMRDKTSDEIEVFEPDPSVVVHIEPDPRRVESGNSQVKKP